MLDGVIKKLPSGTRCDVAVVERADLSQALCIAEDRKSFVVKQLRDPVRYTERFRNEYKVLRQCARTKGSDRYVIEAYSLAHQLDELFLICEYATHGDLFQYAFDNRKSTFEFTYVANYLLRALTHLHERCNVYHGDIKAENIGVTNGPDGTLQLKFLDFEDAQPGRVHYVVPVRAHNDTRHEVRTMYGTAGMGNDDLLLWDRGFDRIVWSLGKQDVMALGKTLLDVYLGEPHSYTPRYELDCADKLYEHSSRADTPHALFFFMYHTRCDDEIARIRDPTVTQLLRRMTHWDPRERPWTGDLLPLGCSSASSSSSSSTTTSSSGSSGTLMELDK